MINQPAIRACRFINRLKRCCKPRQALFLKYRLICPGASCANRTSCTNRQKAHMVLRWPWRRSHKRARIYHQRLCKTCHALLAWRVCIALDATRAYAQCCLGSKRGKEAFAQPGVTRCARCGHVDTGCCKSLMAKSSQREMLNLLLISSLFGLSVFVFVVVACVVGQIVVFARDRYECHCKKESAAMAAMQARTAQVACWYSFAFV